MTAPKPRVHPEGRFLMDGAGAPFFYLADTAWELFHRLDEAEAELFFRDRAGKGFNAVQAVILAEEGGLDAPNANGDLPFTSPHDPTTPNEPYFRHVDRLVALAASHGIVTALVPTWGDKWNKKWGAGPEIFTPENARAYGRYVGERYRDQPVLYIMGADRYPETDAHHAINQAMAEGVREGSGGGQLMTYHCWANHSSSGLYHAEPWLDFNIWQTGHDRRRYNYPLIARDYALAPPKPTLDAEPCYEDHPDAFDPTRPWLDAADVRRCLYWSVFAGGCGFTYGCHDIWQFWEPGRKAVNHARTPWRDALGFPGSTQAGYGRRLLESRPYFSRVPDQSLVVGDNPDGLGHRVATRDAEGSYAMIYLPEGGTVTVRAGVLPGLSLAASWFDPRRGTAVASGTAASDGTPGGTATFTAPTGGYGEDWVLVLDDAARNFPLPGQGKAA